jgi:hypothetical protein
MRLMRTMNPWLFVVRRTRHERPGFAETAQYPGFGGARQPVTGRDFMRSV